MNWFRRLSGGEVFSAVGLLLSVLGQALYIANLGAWSQYMRVFGLAVFLAGVLMVLHKILAALQRQTDENTVLNTVRALAEINSWRYREPQSLYVRATGEVLQHIVSEYVPQMASTVDRFRKNPSMEIEVADHSPIFDLMHRIARNLPNGSVWLGITRLESRDAWTQPLDDGFITFRDLIRRRARTRQLLVHRLYAFEHRGRFAEMKPEIDEETRNGIVARVLVSANPPPPDISLIWIPNGKRSSRRRGTSVSEAEPVAALAADGFEPLCVMIYDTRAGALLTRLAIASGASERFPQMADVFTRSWSAAQHVANQGPVLQP